MHGRQRADRQKHRRGLQRCHQRNQKTQRLSPIFGSNVNNLPPMNKTRTRKTVLITGSSSGIGRETAKLFQAKGWNVAATMRTPSKEKFLNTVENVMLLELDVTKPESITTAVEETIKKFGGIDVVVNNA